MVGGPPNGFELSSKIDVISVLQIIRGVFKKKGWHKATQCLYFFITYIRILFLCVISIVKNKCTRERSLFSLKKIKNE